jgi:DNA-binding response OmpR family regulator
MVNNKRSTLDRLTKVLVIESDIDLRHILSELFDLEGYEFIIHEKSADIVDLVYNYEPDVVLLDYRLPLVNGSELCDRLKHDTKTERIPVIIYSVAPASSLPKLSIKYDAFISKPFDLNVLLSNIENLVRLRQTR